MAEELLFPGLTKPLKDMFLYSWEISDPKRKLYLTRESDSFTTTEQKVAFLDEICQQWFEKETGLKDKRIELVNRKKVTPTSHLPSIDLSYIQIYDGKPIVNTSLILYFDTQKRGFRWLRQNQGYINSRVVEIKLVANPVLSNGGTIDEATIKRLLNEGIDSVRETGPNSIEYPKIDDFVEKGEVLVYSFFNQGFQLHRALYLVAPTGNKRYVKSLHAIIDKELGGKLALIFFSNADNAYPSIKH